MQFAASGTARHRTRIVGRTVYAVPLPSFNRQNRIEGNQDGRSFSMAAISSDRSIRILIADDHPSIRKAVTLMLQEQPDFEICRIAEDGRMAVEEASRLKPDVTF